MAQSLSLRRSLLLIALSVVIFYLLLNAALFLFQSRLIYHPKRTLDKKPSDIGLNYEEVALRAGDGVKISAWYLPSEGASLVVLFCHGNAANMGERIDTLRILHGLGYNVFTFDYRGFGESEGSPTEEGTYADARAAWDFLVNEKGFSPERIVIHGRSLGAAIASKLASERKAAALIVESPFTSIPDIASEKFFYVPVRLISRYDYTTLESVSKVNSPLLLIHSGEDTLIPISHGRAVFNAASEPKEFLEISGTHAWGHKTSEAIYSEGIGRFLKRHLEGAQEKK